MDINKLLTESKSKIIKRGESTEHIIAATNVSTYRERYLTKLVNKIYSPIKDNFSIIEQEYINFNHSYLFNVPADDIQQGNLWKYIGIKFGKNYLYTSMPGHNILNKHFFPQTCSILEDILGDDLLQIGISCLLPGCTLAPHTGYNNDMPHNAVFRTHLTLETPSSDYNEIGMAIYENEIKRTGTPETEPTRKLTWRKGELFTFDDTIMHEVWNKTTKRRVVLMFDTYVDSNVNKHIHINSPYTLKPVLMRQYFEDFQNMISEDYIKMVQEDYLKKQSSNC